MQAALVDVVYVLEGVQHVLSNFGELPALPQDMADNIRSYVQFIVPTGSKFHTEMLDGLKESFQEFDEGTKKYLPSVMQMLVAIGREVRRRTPPDNLLRFVEAYCGRGAITKTALFSGLRSGGDNKNFERETRGSTLVTRVMAVRIVLDSVGVINKLQCRIDFKYGVLFPGSRRRAFDLMYGVGHNILPKDGYRALLLAICSLSLTGHTWTGISCNSFIFLSRSRSGRTKVIPYGNPYVVCTQVVCTTNHTSHRNTWHVQSTRDNSLLTGAYRFVLEGWCARCYHTEHRQLGLI